MERNTVQYKNRYMDSVMLMSVSERLKGIDGVISAEVVMATPANREILIRQGLDVPENTSPSDLLIAVAAEQPEVLEEAFARRRNCSAADRTAVVSGATPP